MSNKPLKPKTMADLEANDCRWPIGDPRQSDFHFCGAQKMLGRPYCTHHWQMSYEPSKARPAQGSKPAPVAIPVNRAA